MNKQRMKNDEETMGRRAKEDATMFNKRLRNDEITATRRSEADRTLDKHRLINDEITDNRREFNDRKPSWDMAMFVLIFVVLTLLGFLVFI